MAHTYELEFRPMLLKDEFPGHLEYVTLRATPFPTGVSSRLTVLNDGLLVQRFARIMSQGAATQLVEDLRAGQSIALSDPIQREQLLALGFPDSLL